MNFDLVSAVTSIIEAKGVDLIDNHNEFMKVFRASAPELDTYSKQIEKVLSSGAAMILAQAKNDDSQGQNNAARISISILQEEAGMSKDDAIELTAAFCTAFGFSFGRSKTPEELLCDARAHIEKNEIDAAMKILLALSSKKDSEAQYLLGYIYYTGHGVDRSYKKAMSYLISSADSDNPKAYFLLGSMYINGHGCTKNEKEAISMWERSAQLGYPNAEYNLAMLYMRGIGVEKDLDKAYNYIKSAAGRGFSPALKELAQFPKKHAAVSEDVISTLEKLSASGDLKSTYMLGNCYFKGDGVPQNKSRAIDYYTKAAKSGHFPSQLMLINRYLLDPEIPPAWSAAYYWYQKAKKTDVKKLAAIHPGIVSGEKLFLSVPKTAKNKRQRYEEAAKLGYIPAYTAIALMYRDSDKALPYLQSAAERGDIQALELLIERTEDKEQKDKYTKSLEYVNKILENCSN